MFEGYTLEAQRRIEEERGWKPTYSALTYCTAEAVVMRRWSLDDPLAAEVVVAKRISGAPDCLGKLQSKWGGYTQPSDPSPIDAMHRILTETFGWDRGQAKLILAGLIGPWLYKATIIAREKSLTLNVCDIQAEKTPFQATLFAAILPADAELGEGNYLKFAKNARWSTIRDLIAVEGENPDHLYWEMTFNCLEALGCENSNFAFHRPPGQYTFDL